MRNIDLMKKGLRLSSLLPSYRLSELREKHRPDEEGIATFPLFSIPYECIQIVRNMDLMKKGLRRYLSGLLKVFGFL